MVRIHHRMCYFTQVYTRIHVKLKWLLVMTFGRFFFSSGCGGSFVHLSALEHPAMHVGVSPDPPKDVGTGSISRVAIGRRGSCYHKKMYHRRGVHGDNMNLQKKLMNVTRNNSSPDLVCPLIEFFFREIPPTHTRTRTRITQHKTQLLMVFSLTG